MELVSNLPKPSGFFDPALPLGTRAPEPPPLPAGAPRTPPNPNQLAYTNSDLAFSGNNVIVGNYHGFNTYNIERANKCAEMASEGWVLVSEFVHEPWDGSAPVLRLSFRRIKRAAQRQETK